MEPITHAHVHTHSHQTTLIQILLGQGNLTRLLKNWSRITLFLLFLNPLQFQVSNPTNSSFLTAPQNCGPFRMEPSILPLSTPMPLLLIYLFSPSCYHSKNINFIVNKVQIIFTSVNLYIICYIFECSNWYNTLNKWTNFIGASYTWPSYLSGTNTKLPHVLL